MTGRGHLRVVLFTLSQHDPMVPLIPIPNQLRPSSILCWDDLRQLGDWMFSVVGRVSSFTDAEPEYKLFF